MHLSTITLVLLLICENSWAEYAIPNVCFTFLGAKGFKASIPADPGIKYMAFHGSLNRKISQTEPGEFSDEINQSKNGKFTYENTDLALETGDVIYYWVFVQHDDTGYRLDGQSIQLGQNPTSCNSELIFSDNFVKAEINERKWIQEQYIPLSESTTSDYEFVYYKKDKSIIYQADKHLWIKPRVDPKYNLEDLDLREGCTKKNIESDCFRKTFHWNPPIASGRILSNFFFRYGRIEVKAKLPEGDWIYPQIYLQSVNGNNQPQYKIFLAYSRGNRELIGNDGIDIGGKLLFGGPVFKPNEPKRSQYLASKRLNAPLFEKEHIYTVEWTPEHIKLFLDREEYGLVDNYSDKSFGDQKFQLVLGVGVGGINDFPDGYQSNGVTKPWINKKADQVKSFYGNRSIWEKTWKGANVALKIDHVKIWPL